MDGEEIKKLQGEKKRKEGKKTEFELSIRKRCDQS